jgi:hypothetical protein
MDLNHLPPDSSSLAALAAAAAAFATAADEAALAAALADSTFAVTESTKALQRPLCLRLVISNSDRNSCRDRDVSSSALLACIKAIS